METNKKLRFAIFGNEYQPNKSTAILTILSYLSRRGAEIYIDRPFYDFLQQEHRIEARISGVFDGNGHTISDISMNWDVYGFAGLFGIISNATVKNLTLIREQGAKAAYASVL